jgi:crotonobetainyl-CoA:carnitine CoA-transferase CaiB-like acyl-CoA transferase
MPTPLEGLRVVEIATGIQGPAVGLHFANMGADVIKVEPPIGEVNRYHRGVNNNLPEGTYGSQYVAVNKGKRSVCLDVHTELGAETVKKLLATADLFVSNYRAPALSRMGLDLNELTQRYPRLIVGHANGFGARGPDADKAMLDGAAQARGGLVSLSGPRDGTPTPPGATIADTAGAMLLALACATALVTRSMTGRGQLVQTSSLGGQLWLQMWELQHSAMTNTPLVREGTHHPNIPGQYGVYETAEGGAILLVGTMTEDAWGGFWAFADRPEVVLREEWDTPAKRIGLDGATENVDELRELTTEAFRSKTMEEWETFLRGQPEIIWERVRGHDDVLTDPQNLENEQIVDLDLPISGMTKTVGTLMTFTDTPTALPSAPPALGEHTAQIMGELGFTEEEIESTKADAEANQRGMFAAYIGDSNDAST